MMKESRQHRHLQALAEEAIPAAVDVWPALQRQIEQKQFPLSRPQVGWQGRRVVFAACVIAVVLVVPVAALATRQFAPYGVALVSDRTPPIATRAGDGCADCGPTITSHRTIAEAQGQVSFPLQVPSWLPAGFALGQITVIHGITVPETVSLTAYSPAGKGFIGLQEIKGEQVGPYRVDMAHAEMVLVSGQSAVYAHGGWQRDPQTGHPHADAQWDEARDASILAWAAGGVTYVLRCENVGVTKPEMLRIAASLR